MTVLVAVLVLLAGEAGPSGAPDAGVRSAPVSRTAEDEEVIRNLDLLEHLADSEALEMMIELEAEKRGVRPLSATTRLTVPCRGGTGGGGV